MNDGTADTEMPEENNNNEESSEGAASDSCMWKEYLKKDLAHAKWIAPVHYFKHAPFSSNWDKIAKRRIIIECPNPYNPPDAKNTINWFAKLQMFAGYKAMVIYYPSLPTSEDPDPKAVTTWIPYCSSIPKPFGYSGVQKLLLYPPVPVDRSILDLETITETIRSTIKRIQKQEGNPPPTLPHKFSKLLKEELKRCASRFRMGEIVEAMDKNDCSTYRVARIISMVGDRILVQYVGEEETDLGFWFNHHSPHIHKLGWCHMVGAKLNMVEHGKVVYPKVDKAEVAKELLPAPSGIRIEEDMIFIMRHPILTHKFCLGYVVKVLKHGYFVAGTDWTRKKELSEIVIHVTSDYIVPLNFCKNYKIPFEIPLDAFTWRKRFKDEREPNAADFSWVEYMKRYSYKELDLSRIRKGPNPFVKGCKLEAVQVTCPVRLKPATITMVAGRLLKLHFDGFPRTQPETFQWVSCDSSNIYPVGYAEMVWHRHVGKPDPPFRLDTINIDRRPT